MAYTLELEDDELKVVVDALRIQRERWQDALMKKLASDPSVSAIPLDDIQEGLRRHEELLARLPSHGLKL
jgi:hypothetical protein